MVEKQEDCMLKYYTVVRNNDRLLVQGIAKIKNDIQDEEENNQIMYISVNEEGDGENNAESLTSLDNVASVDDSVAYSNVYLNVENGQLYLTDDVSTDNKSDFHDVEVEQQIDLETAFIQENSLPGTSQQESNYIEIQLGDGSHVIVDSNIFKTFIENSEISAEEINNEDEITNENKSMKWIQKWICDYEGCGKLYSNSYHLSVHKRVHTGSRPFKCSSCDKCFTTSYSMKSHYRIHTGEKPYPCKHCPKKFKTSGDLKKHNRIHTGEKPFLCTVEGCGKAFATSNIRKVHIRSHTGERPYVCPTCSKGFASATNYRNHLRIHSGEKPFLCKVVGCGKRFTEYSSLYKHKFVHLEARPFRCSYCEQSFKQEYYLKSHKIAEHDVIFDSNGIEIGPIQMTN